MILISPILKDSVATVLVLLCSTILILAQSNNQNYILTKTMLDNTGTLSFDKIDYFDGLGRPIETVLKAASPSRKDIVSMQEYDGAGRPSNVWSPTPTGGTGAYVAPATLKSVSNTFYSDNAAYSYPVYESSSLNRVLEQYGPGTAWHTGGRSVKTDYLSNTSSGDQACALYVIMADNSLQRKGLYAANELFVTQSKNEELNIAYTFTDKLGQIILQRVMKGTDKHDTYFVYDDFGNLRYVLPPAAADALTAVNVSWNTTNNQTIKDYAYYYQYDGRNNCIKKKLPGCDPILMKYDKADRLIFSQDGNQQSKSKWTFYLHDVFGRQTVIGTCPTQTFASFEGAVVKATYTGGATLGGYEVTPALSGTVNLMTVNYYDDYSYKNILTAAEKPKMNMVTLTGYDNAYPNNTSPNAKGLLTGIRTYQLEDVSKYSISALYYDHRGQIIQTHTSNQLGGFEDEYYAYTFTGKVKQKQQVHSAAGKTTQTEAYTYTYDHAERLLAVTHKANTSTAVTLAQYTYDEIGRMKTKKLHATAETLTYDYNVRSWLTQVSGTKFNQTLTYNAPVNGITPTKELYNGNISAMKWKAGGEASERGYQFTYDGVNRLTNAIYGEGATITANPNRFNEKMTYDKMGNITALQRRGKLDSGYGLMDDLTCHYSGNQVMYVSDAAAPSITYPGAFHFVDFVGAAHEYEYDRNGNLTKDLNKNITQITYNVLNLPKVVTFGNANTITYTYDGSGNKLSVAYKAGTNIVKTDYVSNKVYKNGTLSMLHTEEGYITFSGATPTYHYYLKDHQGNNRVVMNQSGAVEQVNHYYPFGGLFGEGLQTVNQPYKYNGKELDRFDGLDMYDYGARMYDAALGRWGSVDPMIEKHFDYSGYAYVYNNPVRFIDVMGLDTIDINYNDDEIWEITNSQIVEGDDVFRITRDGETTTHIFSEGEYGERVNMLNLETNDDYTLGVYHVSGAEWKNGRTGYYVTPGGDASTEVGSGARLPADIYGLQSSPETASWRQIWVTNGKANGNVSARGIKFHFGGSSPADWTQGCFILSSSYTKNGSNIQYSFRESRRATIWMDFHLGANSVYRYATKKYNGSGRIGARFNTTNLTHKLILKDGF